MNAMLKTISLILLMTLCSACSKAPDQVSATQKSTLISEQLIDSPQCKSYKKTLDSPSMSSDDINRIYDDATKAHCIKNDI